MEFAAVASPSWITFYYPKTLLDHVSAQLENCQQAERLMCNLLPHIPWQSVPKWSWRGRGLWEAHGNLQWKPEKVYLAKLQKDPACSECVKLLDSAPRGVFTTWWGQARLWDDPISSPTSWLDPEGNHVHGHLWEWVCIQQCAILNLFILFGYFFPALKEVTCSRRMEWVFFFLYGWGWTKCIPVPMLSYVKVGESTPWLAVADRCCWWWYMHGKHGLSAAFTRDVLGGKGGQMRGGVLARAALCPYDASCPVQLRRDLPQALLEETPVSALCFCSPFSLLDCYSWILLMAGSFLRMC